MTASPRFWRFTPLGSAAFVYLAAVLTFGVGFVLGPLAGILSVLAYRRTAPPRGWVFWVGIVASAALTVIGVLVLALIVYNELL